MKKAVIFDMDGLMFDTERVFMLALDYAGEKIGIGKAGYMGIKTLGMPLTVAEPLFRQEFGAAFDLERVKRHAAMFLEDYYSTRGVEVKPGLYELIHFLQENGFAMAVATSSPSWEAEKNLKSAGVYGSFAAVIGRDMVTKTKPDPALYLKACAALGERPQDCYALEDSRNGLRAAYSAGCKPIMVPDLWQPDAETMGLLLRKCDSLFAVKDYLQNSLLQGEIQ